MIDNLLKMGDICHVDTSFRTSLATSNEIGMLVKIESDSHIHSIKHYWVLYNSGLRGPFNTQELTAVK